MPALSALTSQENSDHDEVRETVVLRSKSLSIHQSYFTTSAGSRSVGRVVPESPPVLSSVPPVSSSVFSSSVPAMVAADGVGGVYAMVGVWHIQANSSISRSSRIWMICFILCSFYQLLSCVHRIMAYSGSTEIDTFNLLPVSMVIDSFVALGTLGVRVNGQ